MIQLKVMSFKVFIIHFSIPSDINTFVFVSSISSKESERPAGISGIDFQSSFSSPEYSTSRSRRTFMRVLKSILFHHYEFEICFSTFIFFQKHAEIKNLMNDLETVKKLGSGQNKLLLH